LNMGADVKENRIRRKAARRGYKLEKSKRRDPLAVDFGLYHLTSAETGGKVAVPASSAHGATADEVEEFLDRRIVRPGSAEDVVLQALRASAITEVRPGRWTDVDLHAAFGRLRNLEMKVSIRDSALRGLEIMSLFKPAADAHPARVKM
jgi:hypothetical protein